MKKLLTTIICFAFYLQTWAALNTPVITSPTSGSINQAPNVAIDWNAVANATGYEYKFGTSSSLAGVNAISTSVSQAGTSNLQFGTIYYFQVRAVKTSGSIDSSAWTSIRNFTVIGQIGLVAPANNSLNEDTALPLDWNGVGGCSYNYQFDTTAYFNSPILVNQTTIMSQTSTATMLLFGTKYFWRVRLYHTADTSIWSSVWNFTTRDTLYNYSPANNTTGVSTNPLIDWSTMYGINSYQCRYSTNANFNNSTIISLVTGGLNSSTTLSNLNPGTKYYWQVRACHQTDTSSWSNTWNFTTTGTTGVEESASTSSYTIYPNPANELITITVENLNKQTPLFIYDNLGRVVLNGALINNQTTINISQLEEGIYILQITGERILNYKIVKN